jgi:iron complex outermembrane recepter protein
MRLAMSIHGLQLAVATALLLPGLVFSQAAADDDKLEEVVVSAIRLQLFAREGSSATKTGTPLIETPMAISVISEERLEAQHFTNIADSLKYVAGAVDSGNTWEHSDGYMVRGFDQSSYILLDGLLRNDPGWWSASEPFGVERVEIIKGPASVLYGQSPPGGMVSMTSKRPSVTARNTLELGYGNLDHNALNLDLNGELSREGNFLGRVIATYMKEGDLINTVQFRRQALQPSFTWIVNDATTVTVLGLHQVDNDDYNTNVSAYGTLLPNPNGRFDYRTYLGEPTLNDSYATTQNTLGYELKHTFNKVWSLQQNFRYLQSLVDSYGAVFTNGFENIYNVGDNTLPQPDYRTVLRGVGDFHQDVRNYSVDTLLLGKFDTGPVAHTLLAGIDYGHFSWDYSGSGGNIASIDAYQPVYSSGNVVINDAYTWTYHSEPRQMAAYVQEQAKLYQHLVLIGGGRYDYATNRDSSDGAVFATQQDGAFSGRIGALYIFDSGISPYVSYATSFLPVVGTTRLGEAFVPETGKQSEFGLKYEMPGGQWQVTVAAFDITRNKMLTKDPLNPNFNVQLGKQRHQGVEVEVQAKPIAELNFSATYSKLNARVVEGYDPANNGKRPWNVPETTASLWASYDLPFAALRGVSVNIGMTYQSDTTSDEAETFLVPSYLLWDAAIHYKLSAWKFSINAENMANKHYLSSCYTTEGCTRGEARSVVATAAYQW